MDILSKLNALLAPLQPLQQRAAPYAGKAGAWLGPRAGLLKALGAPLFIVMVLAMMVLPLPAFVLDVFFTFNIAMALMVVLVAAHMVRPLDFAAFPSVLLITTLMRLSLNVASTRVVLLEGHTGVAAAGHVIESFGHFLIGGNFAVGLIVFAILVVINFIVVTKGAERIAEVGARFTLDAMPGKQMAIDADLSSGAIGADQARSRRKNLERMMGQAGASGERVRGGGIEVGDAAKLFAVADVDVVAEPHVQGELAIDAPIVLDVETVVGGTGGNVLPALQQVARGAGAQQKAGEAITRGGRCDLRIRPLREAGVEAEGAGIARFPDVDQQQAAFIAGLQGVLAHHF